jgi:hypothetical protein
MALQLTMVGLDSGANPTTSEFTTTPGAVVEESVFLSGRKTCFFQNSLGYILMALQLTIVGLASGANPTTSELKLQHHRCGRRERFFQSRRKKMFSKCTRLLVA